MGIGDAYHGLVDLLSRNGNILPDVWLQLLTLLESTTEEGSRIELVVGFAANSTLQPIRRPTDDDIGTWYFMVCKRVAAPQLDS
jgi:histone deacetylase 6